MPASKIKDKKASAKAPAIQFWYGANQSLLQVELARWQAEFKKRHPQSIIERLERDQEDLLPRLPTALTSAGLFADAKLVLLFDFAKSADDLADYLEANLETLPKGIYLIIIEPSKPRASNKLFKKLIKLTDVGLVATKEFNWLTPRELDQWIINKVRVTGGKISGSNASLLASLVGNNFLQLEQEINKLVAYSPNQEITPETITSLVAQKISEDVFVVIDAIGRRDFKQAVKKLEEQWAAELSPQNLLGTLAWHLRVLWQVREYLDEHRRASFRQIAADLNLHPYVASKTLAQIPYYSRRRLQQLYQELSDLDTKLKSTKLSAPALFDLFISRLATNSL